MSTDLEARNRLVEDHTDFARAVARKLARDLPIEAEDAVAAGFEGLCQAAQRIDFDRWDAERGPLEANFRSLAYLRIHGAIMDEVRRNTFTKRRGFEKGLRFDMVPLDKTRFSADGDSLPLLELEHYDEIDSGLLDTLDSQERAVVLGRYAGFRNAEIAQTLQISPARIPQLSRSAREKLRQHLESATL